jgi:acetyl-CoA carboxylase biotin carboxyl carrier protein
MMDFKQIQELIKMINKSNIGELTVEEKGFKLTIKQKEEPAQQLIAATVPAQMTTVSPIGASPAPVPTPAPGPLTEKTKVPEPSVDNLLTIKSPMIGTFYRSPAPGKPPFIEVGDEIVPGKVVCIIEAMKLFNEIESEVKGRLVKILADDASPVEYDQPLFLIEPL